MAETPEALHPILAAAVAAAGERGKGFRSQFGAPPVSISPREMASLAIWCGEWVEPTVAPELQAEFVAVLEEARRLFAEPELVRAQHFSQGNARYPTEHLSIARLAVDAARRAVSNPAATRVAVSAAVKLVVRLERSSVRSLSEADGRVRRFLYALDDELLRLDAVAALEEHTGFADADVDATLWRRAEGTRVVTWITRLGTGITRRYGLLTKQGGRWRWFEGSRDDVLAQIPDELFADAVDCALRRDDPAVT